MGTFKVLPHTADVCLEVEGKDLKDLFETAALGMFSLITNIEEVKEEEEKRVKVEGEDRVDLLVRWLNELLYLHSTGYLFRKFEIIQLKEKNLEAVIKGEKIKPHHALELEIKAATYHDLKIEGSPPRTRIIFDV